MSNTGNLRLAFVIEAIDRATATVGRVNKVIDRVTEPLRRVRAANAALVRESGLERIQTAWANLGQSGQRVMGWMRGVAAGAAALAVTAAGVGYAIKRNFDEVDRLSDQSKKLGITTQAYQRLGFAAQLSGSSQEEMGQALQFLSQNMVEAIGGSKEMQLWFSRVGLSTQQLSKMNVQQVMERIADTFESVGDSGQNAAAKIAFARATMGRGGAELIQTLNQGSKGMRRLYEEAERLGVVLDADVVERITKFNDQVDVMTAASKSAFATVAAAAVPVLARVINGITAWTNANRELVATKLTEFMAKLEPKLPAIAQGAWDLFNAVVNLASGINAVVQWIGGWNTVLAVGAAIMVGQAVVAVYTMTTALWGMAAAFLATPLGVFIAGLAGIVAVGTVLYNTFEPVKKLFDGIWDALKAIFSVKAGGAMTNVPASGAPSIFAGQEEWARYRGTAGTPGVLAGAGGAAKADVSGTLRVVIDSQGKLRRVDAEGGGGLQIEAYTGMAMGPGA